MSRWEADQIISYTYSKDCDVEALKAIVRGAVERLGAISTCSVRCPEAFALAGLKLLLNEVIYARKEN